MLILMLSIFAIMESRKQDPDITICAKVRIWDAIMHKLHLGSVSSSESYFYFLLDHKQNLMSN